MRIIIYTGKGGVGKTSMAAATACKIAKSGKRVLVMSTDQTHSLGDSFGSKIDKEPTHITVELQEDALREIDESFSEVPYIFDMCCEGTEKLKKVRPDLWTCRLIPA